MEWLKWGNLDYGASNKLLSSLGYITQVYVVALPLGVVFAKRYEQFWVSKGDSIIFKAKKKTHTHFGLLEEMEEEVEQGFSLPLLNPSIQLYRFMRYLLCGQKNSVAQSVEEGA